MSCRMTYLSSHYTAFKASAAPAWPLHTKIIHRPIARQRRHRRLLTANGETEERRATMARVEHALVEAWGRK